MVAGLLVVAYASAIGYTRSEAEALLESEDEGNNGQEGGGPAAAAACAYDWVGLTGLHGLATEDQAAAPDDADALAWKLLSIVGVFLVEVYLESHFRQQAKRAQREAAYGEEDYKGLFEWQEKKEGASGASD